MSHSSEARTPISAPPNPDDLRPHEPLTGIKGIVARAYIRRIPQTAGAALLAVGVIAAVITLTGSPDGAPAEEQVAAQLVLPEIQDQAPHVPEVLLVPPAGTQEEVEKKPAPVQQTVAAEKEAAPPAIPTHRVETQVARGRKPLPAIPGIDADMSSIDMGELASAVDSLGIRADQLEEALPKAEQSPKEQVSSALQAQEPVAVETETVPEREQPLPRAMSAEDAEVHQRLVARLEDVQARGDANGVKAAKAELDMFEATLDTLIEFRIIDRQGEKPGFWRTLVDDAKTKQFFVVVEAVVDGKPVNWAVRDADSGKVVSGARFGLRVDEKTFAELSADKKDDGRIDNMVVGLKPVGRIMPVWSIKTDGETITEF